MDAGEGYLMYIYIYIYIIDRYIDIDRGSKLNPILLGGISASTVTITWEIPEDAKTGFYSLRPSA